MSKDKHTINSAHFELLNLQYRQFAKALRSYMADIASVLYLHDDIDHGRALDLADLSILNLERANLDTSKLKKHLGKANDLMKAEALEDLISKGGELLCEQAVFEMDLGALIKGHKPREKGWRGLGK